MRWSTFSTDNYKGSSLTVKSILLIHATITVFPADFLNGNILKYNASYNANEYDSMHVHVSVSASVGSIHLHAQLLHYCVVVCVFWPKYLCACINASIYGHKI